MPGSPSRSFYILGLPFLTPPPSKTASFSVPSESKISNFANSRIVLNLLMGRPRDHPLLIFFIHPPTSPYTSPPTFDSRGGAGININVEPRLRLFCRSSPLLADRPAPRPSPDRGLGLDDHHLLAGRRSERRPPQNLRRQSPLRPV